MRREAECPSILGEVCNTVRASGRRPCGRGRLTRRGSCSNTPRSWRRTPPRTGPRGRRAGSRRRRVLGRGAPSPACTRSADTVRTPCAPPPRVARPGPPGLHCPGSAAPLVGATAAPGRAGAAGGEPRAPTPGRLRCRPTDRRGRRSRPYTGRAGVKVAAWGTPTPSGLRHRCSHMTPFARWLEGAGLARVSLRGTFIKRQPGGKAVHSSESTQNKNLHS